MKHHLSLLAGASFVACATLVGSGPALATPAGYFHQTAGSIPLSATGGQLTTIVTTNISPGNWAITGKAQIVNFGATDIGRCALFVNGTQVDGSGSELGGANNFPAVAVLTTQYIYVATVATKVQLACSHDSNVAGQYVDPSASLMIVRLPTGLIK